MRDNCLPSPFRAIELFAGGCAGWTTGLQWAGGFETVAVCEVDHARRRMLSATLPGVRQYGDIRDLNATRLRVDRIGRIDAIFGSPPCTDASPIKQGARGVDGEETKLFFEWLRLVGELRPRWACAENSASIARRGIDRVLDGLRAEGYRAELWLVEALDFGAPHKRERSWLIAWDETQIGRPSGHADAAKKPARASRQSRKALPANAGNARDMWGPSWRAAFARCVSFANGVSAPDARLMAEALGDAIVPQVAEAIGRAIIAAEIDASKRLEADRLRQECGSAGNV